MRTQTMPSKPGFFEQGVRNSESSILVPGTPVIYEVDGTEDGLSVENSSSSSALKTRLFPAGIVVDTINASGGIGNVRQWGFIDATYVVRTRAATSDSFSTFASLAQGALYSIGTLDDALIADLLSIASADVTITDMQQANFVLAETIASGVGVATATTLTLTVSTGQAKVFVRIL